MGLNCLWRLGWHRAELARLGAELGSDVPFFFSTPAAWCTGRGERVEILGPNISIDECAAEAGTIGYEILTRLGPRFRREYIKSREIISEEQANEISSSTT